MTIDISMAIILMIIYVTIIIIGGYYVFQTIKIKKSQFTLESVKQHDSISKIKRISGDIPSNDLVYRINATNKFLEILDRIINDEIARYFQSILLKKEKYPIIEADKHIKLLSESVQKAIKLKEYNNVDLLITADYIFDYIVSSITIRLLNTGQYYNGSLE